MNAGDLVQNSDGTLGVVYWHDGCDYSGWNQIQPIDAQGRFEFRELKFHHGDNCDADGIQPHLYCEKPFAPNGWSLADPALLVLMSPWRTEAPS